MTDDHSEQKALSDIEVHGCHILHVMADDDHPCFSYSLGIERTSRAPELSVIGLKRELAHFIINEYNRRTLANEIIEAGQQYDGFIEGFSCEFRLVHHSHYSEYFGWCQWLYPDNNFRILQLVYPTTAGIWPWETEASEWFRKQQPLLNKVAV